ncbi:MAG: hypothetical protein MUQ65_17705, partial [Armatimonadetes bacterium]|nr:hypothetical protein [Armatimonadota bacterium]
MSDEERQPDRRTNQEKGDASKKQEKRQPAQGPPRVLALRRAKARADTRGTSPTYLRLLRICRLLVVVGILFCVGVLGVTILSPSHIGFSQIAIAVVIVTLTIVALAQRRNTDAVTRLREGYYRAQQMADLNAAIIASFAMAIDAKDQHTHGHTERVRDIAVMIA